MADIKPNNILLDYEEATDEPVRVQSVRVADLEDSVLLPDDKNIVGGTLGNQFWRSPESWCKAKQNLPSDVFSMGVVAVYIMQKSMIFCDGLKDEDFAEGEAFQQIIMRHISYFWNEDDFIPFLKHIGEDNPFFNRIVDMVNNVQNPRPPFRKWVYIDAELRDLVLKMTRLDPASRISAREALEHPFFN